MNNDFLSTFLWKSPGTVCNIRVSILGVWFKSSDMGNHDLDVILHQIRMVFGCWLLGLDLFGPGYLQNRWTEVGWDVLDWFLN